MANEITSYDPSQVDSSLGGLDILSGGKADGDFITVEPASEQWVTKVGADGSVIRTKVLDKRANVKVSLLPTSSRNAVLQALYASGLAGPFSVRDRNGSVLVEATKAWVRKLPTAGRGKEAGMVEWEIECADADFTFAAGAAL